MEEAAKSFAPMMKVMYNTIGDLSSAFYKKYGKDALRTIAAVSAKSGAEYAKIAKKMMTFKSMKDIGEMFKMMMATMGEKMEIVKLSDDVLHFKMSHCPMGMEGTSQELCEAMMNSDKKDGKHSSRPPGGREGTEARGRQRQILRSHLLKEVNEEIRRLSFPSLLHVVPS